MQAPEPVRALGKMLLQNLQLVVGKRYQSEEQRQRTNRPMFSVVLDEFAPFGYRNFAQILQTARGTHTAFLFSMQSLPQLMQVGRGFKEDVTSAPNTTMTLRTRDEETARYFLQASAEHTVTRRSVSMQRWRMSVTRSTRQPTEPSRAKTARPAHWTNLAGQVSLIGRPVRLELQQLQLARKERASPVEGKDYLGGSVVQQTESKGTSPSTTATIAKAQETTQPSLTSLLSPAGVSELAVHSVGLQPDGELQIEVSASQNRTAGQSPWQVAVESVSHDLGVPLQIRADVTSADRSCELKYGPNSIRLTELQDKELRTFIRASNGPDVNYVLTYSGTADTDLAKRRNAFLDRYFHGASLSSEPDPKLAPDLIVVREKTRFEVHGGQILKQ